MEFNEAIKRMSASETRAVERANAIEKSYRERTHPCEKEVQRLAQDVANALRNLASITGRHLKIQQEREADNAWIVEITSQILVLQEKVAEMPSPTVSIQGEAGQLAGFLATLDLLLKRMAIYLRGKWDSTSQSVSCLCNAPKRRCGSADFSRTSQSARERMTRQAPTSPGP
jgi:hypothetical protein